MTWGKDLQPFGDGQWIVSGEGADSTGGYVICVVLASEGDTIKIIRSYNPYYPLDQFIATPAGLTQLGGNIFWQMNIGNHQTASFSNDLFLVKLNQDLEVNWTKKYISPKDESSWSLVPKGSTLLIGAWKTNFNTNNKKFTTQLYLFQIDTLNGNIIKTFHYPPTPTIYQLVGPADDMLVEDDGSVIVATRFGKEEPINAVSSFIRWTNAILKVNPGLNQVLWEQTMFSGISNDFTQFHKIVKAPDESGYVAAGVANYDTGIMNGALAKVSPDGDSLWLRHFKYVTTLLSVNNIYDLEPTPDGGYVMVGEARPYNAFDTLFPPPIQQGWILKVDEWGCLVPGCQLDVGTQDMPGDNPMALKVYPNPASEVLYIHMPDAKPSGHFSLVDATGRRMKEFDASTGDMTYILPLDGVPPGWYVVVYEEAGGRRLAEEVVVE